MVSMDDLRIRVAGGAAWLDENRPGWVDTIDFDTLNMAHCSHCVLGQCFGDFTDVIMKRCVTIGENYRDTYAWAEDHGFYDMSHFNEVAIHQAYDMLRQAWVELITARRQEAHARRAQKVQAVEPELVIA